jgi:hypothetical protein
MLFKVGAARELGLECSNAAAGNTTSAKLPFRECGFIDARRVDGLLPVPVIVHHLTSTLTILSDLESCFVNERLKSQRHVQK